MIVKSLKNQPFEEGSLFYMPFVDFQILP